MSGEEQEAKASGRVDVDGDFVAGNKYVENNYGPRSDERYEEAEAHRVTDEAIAKYRARLTQECERLPLSSVTRYGQNEGIRAGLGQIFVAPELEYGWPFGDVLELPGGDDRVDRSASPTDPDQAPRRRETLAALLVDERTPWLFVMGQPGAGKSTILRWICASTELACAQVPVMVDLMRFHKKTQARVGPYTFFDFLDERMAETYGPFKPGDFRALAEEGRIFWCFDGLDEVPDERARTDILTRVCGLKDAYAGCRGLITCRVAAAHALRAHLERCPRSAMDGADEVHAWGSSEHPEVLHDEGLTPWVIRPFDRPRIDSFLSRWHATGDTSDPADGVNRRDRIAQALDRSPALLELARTPLLLTFLVLLNRGQPLPVHRHQLYHDFIELMLDRWDANEHGLRSKAFRVGTRRDFLRALAWRLIEASGDGTPRNAIDDRALLDFTEDFCRTKLGWTEDDAASAADDLLRQLRERDFILARSGDGTFAFVHKAIFEYCVADSICDGIGTQQSTIEDVAGYAAKRWRDESWAEILGMVAAILAATEPQRAVAVLRGIWTSQRVWSSHEAGVAIMWSVRLLAGVENLDSGPIRSFLFRLDAILGHISPGALTEIGSDWESWMRVGPHFPTIPSNIASVWPGDHTSGVLVHAAKVGVTRRAEVLRALVQRGPHQLGSIIGELHALGPWTLEERRILGEVVQSPLGGPSLLRALASEGVDEAYGRLENLVSRGDAHTLSVLMQPWTAPRLRQLAVNMVIDLADNAPETLIFCHPDVLRDLPDAATRTDVLDKIERLLASPRCSRALPEDIEKYGTWKLWLEYLVIDQRRDAHFTQWAALLSHTGPSLRWLRQLFGLADRGSLPARAERDRLVRECLNYGFDEDANTIAYFLCHVAEPLPVHALVHKATRAKGVRDLSLLEAVLAREPSLNETKLVEILGVFSLGRRHLHNFLTLKRPWLRASAERAAIAGGDFRWLRRNLADNPLGDVRVQERLESLPTSDLSQYVRAMIDLGVPELVGEVERRALLAAGDDASFNLAYELALAVNDLATLYKLGGLEFPRPLVGPSSPPDKQVRTRRRDFVSRLRHTLKLADLVDILLSGDADVR